MDESHLSTRCAKDHTGRRPHRSTNEHLLRSKPWARGGFHLCHLPLTSQEPCGEALSHFREDKTKAQTGDQVTRGQELLNNRAELSLGLCDSSTQAVCPAPHVQAAAGTVTACASARPRCGPAGDQHALQQGGPGLRVAPVAWPRTHGCAASRALQWDGQPGRWAHWKPLLFCDIAWDGPWASVHSTHGLVCRAPPGLCMGCDHRRSGRAGANRPCRLHRASCKQLLS